MTPTANETEQRPGGGEKAPDFQPLLPEPMRRTWAVVPKFSLYQLVVVGAILGIGAALTVAGFVTPYRWLRPAIAVALVVAWLLNLLLSRRERRLIDQAQGFARSAAGRPTPHE